MSDTNASLVWMVTGCSTGFGRELALRALADGHRVVATARDVAGIEDIGRAGGDRARLVRLDVTDPEQVRAAVEAAAGAFGRLDVLVNNAGYGQLGALEEVPDADVRRQFETNVFGLLAVTRAVLPHMRRQRSGHVVNVSSVGGAVGFPGFGVYNATKFAVEGLSEALAKEAAHLGVRVTIVEPGAFRTAWAGGRNLRRADPIPDYQPSVGATRAFIDREDGNQAGDPARGAAAIVRAVTAQDPPLRLVLGGDALDLIREKYRAAADELDRWEPVSRATAFDGAGPGRQPEPAGAGRGAEFAPVPAGEAAEFERLVRAYCAAWTTPTAAPDYEAAARFYAPDDWVIYYDVLPPRAGYAGWRQLRAGLERNVYGGIRSLVWTPGDVRAARRGDLAVTAFEWTIATVSRAGEEQTLDGRMSILWERRGGEWRIVHEHSSVPFAPAAR